MLKTRWTARHTYTLADFVILNTIKSGNNSTEFTDTSSISLHGGPAIDIPTSLQKSDNNNIFIINIDSESVNSHWQITINIWSKLK